MMTTEDAKIIREFRQGATWRGVARLAAERWPERGYCNGNQLEGMELCKAAARVLGEDPWKEPWN